MQYNFYTNVCVWGNKILFRGVKNNKRVRDKIDYKPSLYVPCQKKSKYTTIKGQYLEKIDFEDIKYAKKFISDYKEVENFKIYGNTKFEYNYISENYDNLIEFDFNLLRIGSLDIEVLADDGFEEAINANKPITCISVKIFNEKCYTWTIGDVKRNENVEYFICKDEIDLIQRFLNWWEHNYLDILTGFNCVPITNSIWKNNYIDKIDNIKYKDEIYNNKFVEHIFPRTNKNVYEIELVNGCKIQSSEEHIFPVYIKNKNSYVDKIDKLVFKENKLKDINLEFDNYLELNLRNNENEPLNIRNLLINNIDYLHSKGLRFKFKDKTIVSKRLIIEKKKTSNLLKNEYWEYSVIKNLLGENEIIEYLNRNKTIEIWNKDLIQVVNLDLDYIINKDDLWKMGFWYTDGTQSYKTEVTYSNVKEKVLSNIERITEKKRIKHKTGVFYVKDYLNNGYNLLFKSFLYENVGIKNKPKKKLDIKLLSQLSKKQFLDFISGFIDGDGLKYTHSLKLCNYNDDIPILSELFMWNGIYNIQTKNILSFYPKNEDLDYLKNSSYSERIDNAIYSEYFFNDSKNKVKNVIFSGNKCYVKIKNINNLNKFVEMIDIKTSTNYFVSGSITTHNCVGYDVIYIVNRISKILGNNDVKRLSPWGVVNEKTSFYKGEEFTTYSILGISILDYKLLYLSYSGNKPEFEKLDFIAMSELGEGKLDYEELGYNSIHYFYLKDYSTYVEYNIQDAVLIEKLDQKLKLLDIAINLAFISKSNFEDCLNQTRMADPLICHYMRKKNIFPHQKETHQDTQYPGAFVKPPKTGIFDWVVSIDATSLYPTCIWSNNISPDTLVEPYEYTNEMREIVSKGVTVEKLLNKELDLSFLKEQNVCLTPNGQFFRNDKKGILVEIVEILFGERQNYKSLKLKYEDEFNKTGNIECEYLMAKYDNIQNAFKLLLNGALYGSLGNKRFRFFDVRLAGAITTTGQLANIHTFTKVNKYFNKMCKTENEDYCLFAHTDSMFLWINRILEMYGPKTNEVDKKLKFINKLINTTIQPYINKNVLDILDYTNSYNKKINYKIEKICGRGIWLDVKNRYGLYVYSNEGVEVPESKRIKVTGIQVVSKATPTIVRQNLKDCLKIILTKSESDVQEYIKQIKKEFKLYEIEKIAFPKGVKGLTTYYDEQNLYKKGTPIHVKSSLIYNKLIKDKNLNTKYSYIQEGERIKFVYLKLPNPLKQETVAFHKKLPKEFGLEDFIDYNKMFEKTFLKPLNDILSCIGWNAEKQISFDDFYNYD